jgi:hypothetical protein
MTYSLIQEHFGNDVFFFVMKFWEWSKQKPTSWLDFFDWSRFMKTEGIIRETMAASLKAQGK